MVSTTFSNHGINGFNRTVWRCRRYLTRLIHAYERTFRIDEYRQCHDRGPQTQMQSFNSKALLRACPPFKAVRSLLHSLHEPQPLCCSKAHRGLVKIMSRGRWNCVEDCRKLLLHIAETPFDVGTDIVQKKSLDKGSQVLTLVMRLHSMDQEGV